LIAKAIVANWLYILNLFRKAEPSEQSNVTCISHDSWTEWHWQFGHVGILWLKQLTQANLVNRFNVDTNSLFIECEPCIAAKQAHMPCLDHAEPWNTVPGEFTHTDLWGPTRIQVLNRARYNIVLVDDSSSHIVTEQGKNQR
jgi:GAG-pre-integrase domain